MIRKRPELDTTNPPGQIVNFEKPLVKQIEEYQKCTSRFTPNGTCFKSECDCGERGVDKDA